MNTFLRYFARGIRSSPNDLKAELDGLLGKRVKHREELNSYEFRANFNELLRVCFHSRLIEGLTVQVGNKFEARDERELIQALQRTPFNNFWRVDSMRLPKLKVNVQYSVLPERHVHRIVEEYMQRMPVMRAFSTLQLEAKGLASLNDVQSMVNKQIREQKESKRLQIEARQDDGLQQKSQEIVKTPEEDPDQISFYLHLEKNFGRFYTPVNRLPMYKHGWKRRVGWGPIKQSLAASILTRTGIIEHAKKNGKLALWDPFCGSGTFLLEALSMLNDLPVREDIDKNFHLLKWPCFKQEYFEAFQAQQAAQAPRSMFPSKILGSDISLQAINYTIENFRHLKLEQSQPEQQFLKKKPACNIFQAAPNTFFVAEDFQKVGEELLNLKAEKFTVIANLPYGIRSKETIESQQLSSIYRRFSEFIDANYHNFENVFVIVPVEEKYNSKHFLGVSRSRWALIEKYYSGGIKIGVYALKDVSLHKQIAVRQSTQLAQRADSQLVTMQVERPVTPTIETDLPKYLIPKKPRNVRERILWRRKIHQLRLAYQKHMEKRLSIKNIQDFRSNVLRLRLQQRGESWKKQNLSLLQNAPQKFEEDIRKAFEKRIVTAMEKKDKEKEKKEEKKKLRTGKKVVRKW